MAQSPATARRATDATDAQEVGVVNINTTLDYGAGAAAGTGMILTPNGEILTNHHVVEGATSINVQVVSTGNNYTADVVGYDATNDVAVLQLRGDPSARPIRRPDLGGRLGGESPVDGRPGRGPGVVTGTSHAAALT